MTQDWDAALTLGVRLGIVAAEAAARARERLIARGGAPPAITEVAEWAGVEANVLDRLLGVLDLGTRTGGIAAVAEALLTIKKPLQDAEPTLRLPRGTPQPDAPTAATPPSGPLLPNVPRTLGPYELIEPLGHGGMGVVFRARHERLGHLCAVKVLIAGEHASAEAIARFQREAASVAKMGKHPNIVTVHDLGQEGSLVWYAMELVEGKSMRAVLAQRDVAPEEAARWVEKVARAVHFAHTKGVIHRDLKPDNVVIGADGEPQVMDFGLALDVSTSARISVTGDVFGSPNYMAPEQARGEVEKSDARTDVYGLGGILYEALTKLPPHPGKQVAEILTSVLRGEVLSPRRVRPDVPRDLETLCLKCLDSEQSRRYATAEALADDLARFLRGEPVHARPVGRVERAARWVRRNPLASAAAVAILVALFGGVGLAEWRASARRQAEFAGLVAEAEGRLARLPGDREGAIRELVTVEERLRAAQELMAAHGGAPLPRRYDVNLHLGKKALEGHDYLLARLAFSVCRSVDAHRADADGLDSRVDVAESLEADRRKGRIAAEIADLAQGLGRPGRGYGAPDLDDFVFEVSGYRDEQTVRLLGEALKSLQEKGRREGKDAHWTQEEQDEMTFAFRVLGRLGLESAVEPLGGMMDVLWDHTLAVECATALCNTRSRRANEPLARARGRFGLNSSLWRAIEHSFARLPSPEVDRDSKKADVLTYHGAARLAKGDVDGAIDDYTRAIEIDPKDASAYNNRGLARKSKGDVDGAIEDFTQAMGLDPKNADIFNNRGVARQDRGDLKGAIEDYDRAIEIDPNHATARNNRGNARDSRGDVRGAIEDYSRAIEIDPRSADAFNNRAAARTFLGDPDGAIQDCDRAIELDPKNVSAFTNRGNARKAKRDLDGAIEDYTRAIEIDPRCANAFANRGVARKNRGDLEGAIADYTRAVELDPKCAEALYNRGNARQARGDLEGAIQDYTRAIEINPRYVTAFDNRGVARMARGDVDGAIEDYTRAIELDPTHPDAISNRGNALQATGNLAGAIADWERWLELAPDDPDAAAVRAALTKDHYSLACVRSLASLGKVGSNAPARPVDAAEAARLRDDAFQHLREAVKIGYADAKHLESDTDLAPLHDDPRWAELLKRLDAPQHK